jgi:hypothetical protein
MLFIVGVFSRRSLISESPMVNQWDNTQIHIVLGTYILCPILEKSFIACVPRDGLWGVDASCKMFHGMLHVDYDGATTVLYLHQPFTRPRCPTSFVSPPGYIPT